MRELQQLGLIRHDVKAGVVSCCYRYRQHRPHKTDDEGCYGYINEISDLRKTAKLH